jgi:CheY-like chemotaxis protein
LEQLFQPFNRLGQESGGEEGTGIGLVVAKKLIEMMGGSIGVESTPGVGTVFWFELKVGVQPQLEFTPADHETPGLAPVEGEAVVRTLLYVEDNPANLSLVERLIARRPELRLLTALAGRLGIEMARQHQPEVILMDINLPDLNGIDALHAIRNDPASAHIPVIAISADAMPHDIVRGLQAGFFEYLTKPILVKEFTETLNKALSFSGTAMGRMKGGASRS